jgi:hypothetical protein
MGTTQSEKEGNLSVTFGDPCRFSVAASLEILSLNKTHMNRKLVCRLFLDGRSSQDVDFPLTEKTMTGRFCYEKDPKYAAKIWHQSDEALTVFQGFVKSARTVRPADGHLRHGLRAGPRMTARRASW